ncbi:MAG TPA: biopolymer transporter ExbD [Bryobacteraceae bacterium]|nr:biopolymer transporter ExbD [Bryobacteraceae bacterium]
MKIATNALIVGTILMVGIGAQTPALKQGVSVDMPVADHAVEVRAADGKNAVIVAITANGTVYVGTNTSELAALHRLSAGTVYVKADARAQYHTVLRVMDALHGKSVVLLSAPPDTRLKQGYLPPYGTKLIVSR